jgi:hypothetical protein
VATGIVGPLRRRRQARSPTPRQKTAGIGGERKRECVDSWRRGCQERRKEAKRWKRPRAQEENENFVAEVLPRFYIEVLHFAQDSRDWWVDLLDRNQIEIGTGKKAARNLFM